MAANETQPSNLVGGRYALVAEIGHGGMGRVWEARDTRLDRSVALKEVLLPGLPPAQQEVRLKQAQREGKNAAAMADHPNIVTVFDVVVDQGSPWIVMQLVKGRSLRRVLRDPNGIGVPDDAEVEVTPLSVERVRQIAEAMLSALDTMHRAGIVHRDIKPHNILMAEDGGILLSDFGIAKAETDATVTLSGSVMGTMAYMAPERAEGAPETPASDYFSLGVTLFEAVEGYSPFEKKGSNTGTLTAILTRPLPTPVKAGPLAPLIEALTLKLPEQRPNHEQALALLRGGAAMGWITAPPEWRAAGPVPPDTRFQPMVPASMGKMPWESVTLTGSAGLPRPSVVATPHLVPQQRQLRQATTRRAGLVIGSVLMLLAIGSVVGLIVNHESSHNSWQYSDAGCNAWFAALEKHTAFVREQQSSSLDPGSQDMADFAEQASMMRADAEAESQTTNQALRAALQQAVSDHSSLELVYLNNARAYDGAAGVTDDTAGYNRYFGAVNNDDVKIQTLCNGG